MDVHIEFIGLHLFAPDPDGKRVHVLMPATGPAGPHQHKPIIRHKQLVNGKSLRARHVDLARLGGSGGNQWPLDYVLNVERTGGRKLPKGQIGKSPNLAVAARVVLPLPSKVDMGERVRWRVPGEGPRRLTHRLTWIIRDVDDSFALQHGPLRPGNAAPQSLPWPDPVVLGGRPVRKLRIEHLTDDVHCIKIGAKADHVQSYYELTGGAGDYPTLIDPEAPACDPMKLQHEYTREERTTLAYNCMLGQSGVGGGG